MARASLAERLVKATIRADTRRAGQVTNMLNHPKFIPSVLPTTAYKQEVQQLRESGGRADID